MKRIIAIVLCILLALGLTLMSCAFAEEFQFRNGITFDDSIKEVQEKETLKTSITKENDGTMRLTTEQGIIDGIPDSIVVYIFDDNDVLCDITVSYRETSKDGDVKEQDYSDINVQMRKQFGVPMNNEGTYEFVGSAIENASLAIAMCKYIGGSGWAEDYDEWVIRDSKYNKPI